MQGWQKLPTNSLFSAKVAETVMRPPAERKNRVQPSAPAPYQLVLNMMLIIGLIGSFLILLSWIWGLYDEIKSKKNLIEIKFSIINLFGIFFLLVYSLFIGELPFIILNSGLFVLILFEIIYSIKISK